MALLDGKALAARLTSDLEAEVSRLQGACGRAPTLDVILVGNDPASEIYVRNKARACRGAGIVSHEYRLPAETTREELHALIRRLGEDPCVDGLLVQFPLPLHLDQDEVTVLIPPDKDVDGYHPHNLGQLLSGKPGLISCTPLGCMKLLEHTGISIAGKSAVVVGRSNNVGKPMALLLLERHATVTVCHSRTEHLAHLVAEADIVIAAVGKPELIKGDWIKKGAVVVDVGINRLEDGSIKGDVDQAVAKEKASWITPVPGGVGPMTIACLLANTVTAMKRRLGVA